MDWDLLGRIVTGVLSVTTIIATALVGVLFGSLKTFRDTAADLRSRVGILRRNGARTARRSPRPTRRTSSSRRW